MEALKQLPIIVEMMRQKAIDRPLQKNQTNDMNLANEFLTSCIKRFNEYKTLGDRTFAQLTEEEMHHQPDATANSIAMIIQHMHGNMVSRWTNFLTEDGEKE